MFSFKLEKLRDHHEKDVMMMKGRLKEAMVEIQLLQEHVQNGVSVLDLERNVVITLLAASHKN